MKKSFLNREKPMLTVMLECATPELTIGKIRNANCHGADAYGVQIESLEPQYHNEAVYKKLFDEMGDRPSYVTYYRTKKNADKTDEELAEGQLLLAKSGANLVDVMGDLFCQCPGEMTENAEAIEKQMKDIDELHKIGAEVIMSSHILTFTPAERILEIAREQKRRGADIIKIVSGAETMEQQIENLRITDLLKREFDAPFLFLSSGVCSLHRRLGINLGCCMALCVYEHDESSFKMQPLLSTMKNIQNNIDF